MLCLVDLWEIQSWGSLVRKKAIIKMYKQLTVFVSEAEPQEPLGAEDGRESSVCPDGIYKYCFASQDLTVSIEFFKL